MTHGEFSVFVTKEGFYLHNILPRTLECLSRSSSALAEDDVHIQNLVDEVKGDLTEDAVDKDWESMLDSITSGLSFADINQKRKQLAFAAFQKESFVPRTLLLEYLMTPLVDAMGLMFERSEAIATLHHLPGLLTDQQKHLMQKSCRKHLPFDSQLSLTCARV